jgi:uncharacterized Zn finger protein
MKTVPKQKTPMSSIPSYFTDGITFDILATWAGEAVFQRGRVYQKAGKVRNIALASEDRLLATVDGTRKYATLLFRKSSGELASLCTCPYGPRCKHAIALACACLALSTEKQDIPLASDNDSRLLDLDITSPDETAQAGGIPSPQEWEATLNTFSKKQLIDLLLQAALLAPEVAALCLGKTEPQQKNALAMVKDARKAIRKALEAPDWDDYYRGTPDYEPVCKKLEVLRLAGFPAEVLELGFDLIEDSRGQIEMCDDEGETRDSIAQCMDIVLQALRNVNWPMHEKLLWAADAVLTDDFAVCDCFWEILRETHPPAEWNPVADALLSRVVEYDGQGYARRALIDMTVHALAAAGRDGEILDLHRQEAVHSGEYLPLVKYLLEKGEDREAEEWIHRGVVAMRKEPYTAERLRSYLLDLRKKQNDWDAVLCIQTEDFVRRASLEQFKECRRSAEKLSVWPVMRPLLMEFLIERKIPWDQAAWPCRNRGTQSRFMEKHPDFTTLIDLAIAEKQPAEVLQWYDLQRKAQRGYGYSADRVAAAVRDFAPERAIALWKGLAEAQIALTKPKAYVEAAVFLRKMGKLMHERSMTTQWETYVQSLRHIHRRKPRLMEVLDGLSSKGISAVGKNTPGK